MKNTLALILILSLSLTSALAVDFTDSTGRVVSLPESIQRVGVTGPLAQIVVFALAPDKMVGVSDEWNADFLDIIGEYQYLPKLGQLYGGKGDMNLEAVAAADPQVIIDIGEPKGAIAEDLDALTEQLGIPFVHVDMSALDAPDAIRALGKLLGLEGQAEEIASFCEWIYARVAHVLRLVGNDHKARVLYCLGDDGLNVVARGSYHAQIIDYIADNLAVVDNPSSRGTGNEVDMEQIILWDPDYIIFAPDSIGAQVANDPAWQSVKAVANGRCALAPFGPHNWMGFPPSIQRALGMLWMASLLYPECCDFDLYECVARYYELFYHHTLTRERFDEITANSFFVP